MKKLSIIYLLLFITTFMWGQSLPFDFEAGITTADFIDFDGGTAQVIANPFIGDTNPSENVAKIVRNAGAIWAGSKIDLDANLVFTTDNAISLKVYTTAPIGTTVKLKLEGNGTTERDMTTTKSGEWETLTWDFTGEPANFFSIVFMFDFGNEGDGSENSTFYFDDVEQYFGGFQIDWPVDFESMDVNYTTTDFGGNISNIESDPSVPNNNVIKVVKTNGAAEWAGTTIGTPAGFATDLPLTLSDSWMTIKVWSPDAGIPVRLKVEDSSDPTHTCETEAITTKAGEWEYLEFDFSNEAPGTAALTTGLSMGWTYNMASIFFDFGSLGSADEKTYFFDDVEFGALIISTEDENIADVNIYPNPATNFLIAESLEQALILIELYDINGKLIEKITPQSNRVQLNLENKANGIYIIKTQTIKGTKIQKITKE